MKLGAQTQAVPSGFSQFISKTKPRIWKLLGNALNVDTAKAIKQASPNTFVVGRLYVPDQPYGNPESDAQNFATQLLQTFAPFGDYVDAIEGYNEIIIFNPDDAKRYNTFQAELSRQLRIGGRKSVAYNFSVGHPELFSPTGEVTDGAMWQYLLDGLVESDYLGLHEYGAPDLYTLARYLTLRHRDLYMWIEQVRPAAKKPLIVTEAGQDWGILPGNPLAGFKAHGVSYDEYEKQLTWWNGELEKDDYVLGATIFLFGFSDSHWESFDLSDDAGQAMFSHLLLSSPVVVPPTPTPTPTPTPIPPQGGNMEIVDYSFPAALTQVGAVGEAGTPLKDKEFYRIMGATIRQGISAFMNVYLYQQDGSPAVGRYVVNLFPDGNGEVQQSDASGRVQFYFAASSAFTAPGTGPFTIFVAESASKDFDSVPKHVTYSNILSDITHSLGDFRGEHTEISIQLKDRPLKPATVPVTYTGDVPTAVLTWSALSTGISLNPDAALQKKAKELGFTKPLTNESRISIDGVVYAVQAFQEASLYCVDGDWGNIKVVKWL